MTRTFNQYLNAYALTTRNAVVVRRDADDDQNNGAVTDNDPVPTGSGQTGLAGRWPGHK